MKIHIVKKGDTLKGLAAKYGVNPEAISSANSQLAASVPLQPGMKIKVPSAPLQATVAQLNHRESRDAKSELDYEYEVLDAQEPIDLLDEKDEEEADEEEEANAPNAEKKEKKKDNKEKPDSGETNPDHAKHPFQQGDVPAYEAGSFHELPEIPGMSELPWGVPYEWPGMEASYPGLNQEQAQQQEQRHCHTCMGSYPTSHAETMAVPYPIAAQPYAYQSPTYWMQPASYYSPTTYMTPYAYGAASEPLSAYSPYSPYPAYSPYAPYPAYPRGEEGALAGSVSHGEGTERAESDEDESAEPYYRTAPTSEASAPKRQQRSKKPKRKARAGTRAVKEDVKSQNTPWINL